MTQLSRLMRRRRGHQLGAAAPLRQALTALALGVEQTNPFERPCRNERGGSTARRGRRPSAISANRWRTVGSLVSRPGHQGAGQLRPLTRPARCTSPARHSYDDDLADILQQQYEHFRADGAAQGQARRAQAEPGRISPRQGHQHQSARGRRRHRAVPARRGEGDHRRRGAGPLAQRRIPGRGQRPGRRAQDIPGAVRRPQPRRAGQDAEPGPADRAGIPVPVADHRRRPTWSFRCRS